MGEPTHPFNVANSIASSEHYKPCRCNSLTVDHYLLRSEIKVLGTVFENLRAFEPREP